MLLKYPLYFSLNADRAPQLKAGVGCFRFLAKSIDNDRNQMHTLFLLAAIIVFSPEGMNQRENSATKPTRMLVDFWCGGDDLFTQWVCHAAEKAFESSEDFALNLEENTGTLVVTIPTNVDWKIVKRRTRVSYVVEFTTADDKQISRSKGSCWEDDYGACANQILKAARIARRKATVKRLIPSG